MPLCDYANLDTLVENAEDKFFDIFGEVPTVRVAAPGRVNLIGEHTDYNKGYVLPMALPMFTVMVSREAEGNKCSIHTMNDDIKEENTAVFSVPSAMDMPGEKVEKWPTYIRGVISTFQLYGGHRPPSFDAVIASSVPLGCGLSSSAALEVATLRVCQAFTNFTSLSATDSALLCQRAEHIWAGSPCGLMDQLIVLEGKRGHALLIDCQSNECTPVMTNFSPDSESGAKVVIIDSGVKHRIAKCGYASRREECAELAKLFGVDSLRELQSKIAQLPELIEKASAGLSDIHAKRLRHILTENDRVLQAVNAMKSADLVSLGKLMQESHASMRDDFEISCEEIDQIVEICASVPGVYGARMTGGGFGGCVVALVKPGSVKDLVTKINDAYKPDAQMFVVEASGGARTLPDDRKRTKSFMATRFGRK
ncbi:hypothetical protein AAHC03_026887 [Spirometra sp. Aus1]